MKSGDWLLVVSKPRMEAEAAIELRNQNYESYAPRWVEMKRRAGGWQRVESAMFPRYLFVRTTYPQQDLTPIRSTRGVQNLVRFGQATARVDDRLVQQIRQLESSRFKPDKELKPFKKGQQVQVLEGPFAGVSAQVFAVEERRVILLLELINQQQTLEFEAGNLVAS